MDIRWTPQASSSLEHISLHISDENPEAALVLSPLPYIVVYRVKETTVEILQICHGTQGRD
jgi:plasmid stabilization system protein ParE